MQHRAEIVVQCVPMNVPSAEERDRRFPWKSTGQEEERNPEKYFFILLLC